jgi:hypothetical protein
MPKSKSKSKTNTHSQHHKKDKKDSKLLDLFRTLSSKRKSIAKHQNNLTAKLIRLEDEEKGMQESQPKVYSKSVSSSYSSLIENGHKHQHGKEIVNESTKPFIEVREMENGHLAHYMIPKQYPVKVIHIPVGAKVVLGSRHSKTKKNLKSKSKSRSKSKN